MSWASSAKDALRRGETVQIRPRGHSITGKVNDGDLGTLVPCDPHALAVGEIVLVLVHDTDFLYLIKAIQGERFLIGNLDGSHCGDIHHSQLLPHDG